MFKIREAIQIQRNGMKVEDASPKPRFPNSRKEVVYVIPQIESNTPKHQQAKQSSQ
jgi:hypothetical protein